MRFLQLVAMGIIAAVGIRWAIREGNRPPEEERQLIIGYDEDGVPIVDPECDVEGTLEMWHDMYRRAKK